ncbi:MAG: FHA domain-containing protein [Micrococcales bacterium]|nr:FHA domain-containing protein [Micrococcales bacterium]
MDQAPNQEPDQVDSTQVFGEGLSFEPETPAPAGLSPQAAAAVEALPPGTALLVVQSGPNSGSRFLLDDASTTAGRSTKSDIFLDDFTVSRRHAVFERLANGQFEVRDLGSLNGTYVGRERVERAVLNPGDEVLIGKYRLTFHPSPAATGLDSQA